LDRQFLQIKSEFFSLEQRNQHRLGPLIYDKNGVGNPKLMPNMQGIFSYIGGCCNDGRLDALVVTQNGLLVYLHNQSARGGHFVTLRVDGRASDRDGVGAADLWEVLAIIGMTQLLLLPVITAGRGGQLLTMLGLVLRNVFLAYLFNWNFVHGLPNAVSDAWGAERTRAWDSRAFGLLGWVVPILAGTLAHHVMATRSPTRSSRAFLGWGVALRVFTYALSCLTTLYNVDPAAPTVSSRGELADSPSGHPWSGSAAGRSRACSPSYPSWPRRHPHSASTITR
jgi:hypothetical protein